RLSRRRFTVFCARALVSNQILPSITPYHMATRCGTPFGPIVAIVAVRLRSMNSGGRGRAGSDLGLLLGVDLDAGAHRRRGRDAPQVLPLRGGRLRLHDL